MAARVQRGAPAAALPSACSRASALRAPRAHRCVVVRAQQKVAGQGKAYLEPVEREAAAFAPATVANLGPGFDWMGCAVEVRAGWGRGEGECGQARPAGLPRWLRFVHKKSPAAAARRHRPPHPPHRRSCVAQGEGDVVTARVLPDRPGKVVIEGIEGDGGRLSLDAPKNCVGALAAAAPATLCPAAVLAACVLSMLLRSSWWLLRPADRQPAPLPIASPPPPPLQASPR